MRVGLIIYGGLDTVSGGYLYDRKLVEHLEDQGDEVEIISLPWRSYARHLLDNVNRKLFQKLSCSNFDILLQDELNHPSLFWLNQRLRSRISYPIVSIVHHLRSSEVDNRYLGWFQGRIEEGYLNSLDGFIFNSATTRTVVEKLILSSKPGVVAFPAGDRLNTNITDEFIRQRAHQAGPLRIIFLGNVIPRKGLHTLLDALDHLSPDSWQLLIAGSLDVDISYSNQMQDLVEDREWQQQVQFMGSLADDRLVDQLKESHILAVPSSYEGFGIAYLEGMFFGLPAVGSQAGGAVEIITHGQDGYLIEPEDTQALAAHLQSLAADREVLEKMSLAALQRSHDHPGWDESMERIRAFLLDLI